MHADERTGSCRTLGSLGCRRRARYSARFFARAGSRTPSSREGSSRTRAFCLLGPAGQLEQGLAALPIAFLGTDGDQAAVVELLFRRAFEEKGNEPVVLDRRRIE